jgi:hypothetical protein
MRLEELGELKNPMTSSRIEPVFFRLVAECPSQLRYGLQVHELGTLSTPTSLFIFPLVGYVSFICQTFCNVESVRKPPIRH